MPLPRDLLELLSELGSAGVRYLVIGGHAVSLHARPRSTKDLDLWLDGDRDNVERACDALERFGVPAGIVGALRDAGPDEIVWMGRAPLRVDFLQSIPGVEFAAAWPRRVTVPVDGVEVSFIGRDDLVTNKRATARPQDLRDARAIEQTVAPPRRASSRSASTRGRRRR